LTPILSLESGEGVRWKEKREGKRMRIGSKHERDMMHWKKEEEKRREGEAEKGFFSVFFLVFFLSFLLCVRKRCCFCECVGPKRRRRVPFLFFESIFSLPPRDEENLSFLYFC